MGHHLERISTLSVTVGVIVGRIFLLGLIHVGILPAIRTGRLQALLNAGADIPGVVDQDHLLPRLFEDASFCLI